MRSNKGAARAHLIKNAAHPVKEDLEEVAFEEGKVQVTLLQRLWASPPVPVQANATVVLELGGNESLRPGITQKRKPAVGAEHKWTPVCVRL